MKQCFCLFNLVKCLTNLFRIVLREREVKWYRSLLYSMKNRLTLFDINYTWTVSHCVFHWLSLYAPIKGTDKHSIPLNANVQWNWTTLYPSVPYSTMNLKDIFLNIFSMMFSLIFSSITYLSIQQVVIMKLCFIWHRYWI